MTGERLAMFPLGSVVFPYSGIPLRVFEPRYLELLDHVGSEAGSFGTVMIERGFEVGGGDVRTDVGTRVRVIAEQRSPGGEVAIVVAGVERIRVVRWLEDDPHPWALVESMPDDPQPIGDLRDDVTRRLERVLALASELGTDTSGIDLGVADDPIAASYQLAALVPVTPLDSHRLLAAPGPRSRLEAATAMLDEQFELMRSQLGGS